MRELIAILAAGLLSGCSDPPPVQLQCTINGRSSYTSEIASFVHADGSTYRIAKSVGAMTFAYVSSYTASGGELCVIAEIHAAEVSGDDA